MTASQFAKSLGCKGIKEVSKVSGFPYSTLVRWYKEKPEGFKIVCIGVAASK